MHELKQLKQPASPLTPRSIDTFASPTVSKKERKAIKKSQKISEMAKVVSTAEIDFVFNVLHPRNSEADDIDIERQLAKDEDIRLNRFFHKGTGNTREVRSMFVKKKPRGGGKEEVQIDPAELDGILQLLNVSPITSSSCAQEKAIVERMRKKIEDDLICEHNEQEQMKQRKQGFWRWASGKALKRLLEHGKNWGDKSSSPARKSDATTSSSSSAICGAEDDTESTEPDTDEGTQSDESVDTPSEDSITETMATLKIKSKPLSLGTPYRKPEIDDGWTTVAKPGKQGKTKVKEPIGNFKLVHNKGLAKIGSPNGYSHGFYFSMLGHDNDA